MEQIKLRAWDGKRMWYHGICITEDGWVFRETGRSMTHKAMGDNGVDVWVTQCIFLQDKEGKNIYNGDIGWYMSDEAGETEVGYHEVVYRKGLYGIKSRTKDVVIPIREGLFKVKSNIYENPELLK